MDTNNNNLPKRNFPVFTVLFLAVLILILILSFSNSGEDKKITYTEFQHKLESGEVAQIDTVGNVAKGIYFNTELDSSKFPNVYDFYFTFTSAQGLKEDIDKYNEGTTETPTPEAEKCKANYDLAQESWLTTALPFIYIALLLLIGFFIFKSISKMTRGNDFGKNKARMETNIKVRFDDVAGCDEEKQEMSEIVEFLKNPKKFTDLGARVPKGVLLVGPPGTGKTLLGKAIAGEAGVPFFSITGSDFVEMFVGVGAARVRDLFETAKKSQPCLIFIDEIDAVGRQRGTGLGNTNDEREQTLNQLLVQMDGFESSGGIIVLAATNRPDVLDPALLRAGRFDRRIVVNRPDVKAREKILELYARNKPFAPNINFESVARRLPGATGADIENILNEAAILAAREAKSVITFADIMEGISKVSIGPKKKTREVTEKERESTAYHESGHTIITCLNDKFIQDVQEVSIIPRGMAGGYTMPSPLVEYTQHTREQILDQIRLAMAGRAAEMLQYGVVATGASNDIKVATDYARSMVTEYGMSEKLGPVCYAGDGELFLGRDIQSRSSYSEQTANLIDQEIKEIINNCLNDAKAMLAKNKKILDEMVKVLLAKDTIYRDEVKMLIEGKSAVEVIAEMDKAEEIRKKDDAEAKQKRVQDEEKQSKERLLKSELLRAKAMQAFNEVSKTEEAPQKTPKQNNQKDKKETAPKEEQKTKKTIPTNNNKTGKDTTDENK